MKSIFLSIIIFSQNVFAVVNATPFPTLPLSVQDPIREKTVRLIYYNSELGEYRTFCSGYLSASNQVISAGHCFSDTPNRAVYAEVYNSQTKRYERVGVSSYKHIDPGNNGADIAQLTLERDVSLQGQQSLPMVLPSACDPGRPFMSAGFGLNNEGNTGHFNITQYTQESLEHMSVINKNAPLPMDSFVLRANGPSRVCGGDSGGPVFCFSKGRVSLVGVNQAIRPRMFSMANGSYDLVDLCQTYDGVVVSRLSQLDLLRTVPPHSLQNMNTVRTETSGDGALQPIAQ